MSDNFRQDAIGFENVMRQHDGVDMPHYNHFGQGWYMRELPVPAGHMVAGMIHKTYNIFALIKGQMAISSGLGRDVFTAPFCYITQPGEKRFLWALTDCVIANIHETDETDPEILLDMMVCNTYEEFDKFLLERDEKQCLG